MESAKIDEYILNLLSSENPKPDQLKGIILRYIADQIDKEQHEKLLFRLIDQTNQICQTVQKSEAYFHILADEATDMISKHDVAGNYIYVSPSCKSLLGYSEDELIGKSAYDFFHPEDLQAIIKSHSSIKEVPDVYTVDYRILKKDQTYTWFETTSKLIRDKNQDPLEIMAISRDISERKEYEMALKLSEEKYRSVVEAIEEGIVVQNQKGEIITSNKSAEKILGLSLDQMKGRTSIDPRWRSIHEDGTPFPGEEHPAMVTLATGKPQKKVIMGVHKTSGELTWISINSIPISIEKDQKPQSVVSTFIDITDRKNYEDRLKKISITDHLTQIYNRLWFIEVLEKETYRSYRTENVFSIIMFDIDHFKKVNDTFGHDVGDYALKTVCQLTQECIRKYDTFARWGGEEFIILLPNTQLEDALCSAERIRAKIESFEFEHFKKLTSSFGVTQYKKNQEEADSLLKRVDDALYYSKKNGRNQVNADGNLPE